LHAECEADSRDLGANIAEAENAERLTAKTVANRELPAARAQLKTVIATRPAIGDQSAISSDTF
jgi:hypothetical protein